MPLAGLFDSVPESKIAVAQAFSFINKCPFLREYISLPSGGPEEAQAEWLPFLCLLSAKTVRGINNRVMQLAESLYLLALALSMHKPPYSQGEQPLLKGDLFYALVYTKLCRQGLEKYIPVFAQMIAASQAANCRLAKRSGALAAEYACRLGSQGARGSSYFTELLSSLGYCLGIILNEKMQAENSQSIELYVQRACGIIASLPDNTGTASLQALLLAIIPEHYEVILPRLLEVGL